MIIEQPAKWLRWLYPRALWRMDPAEHSVYLTFDDGPIPQSTPFILDTLDEFGAKATFFMVGDNVRRYPGLLEDIRRRGHAVGNHTYHHIGSLRHWPLTYGIDVSEADKLLGFPKLFRPPHGWMRPSVYWWMSRRKTIVMWDLVTRDYSKWMTADDIIYNVKRYARNGSIITFHDSLKSIEKLHYALPESLRYLREQGYEFRTF